MSSSSDTGNRGDAVASATVGVQELIDRLKSEGVEVGQQRADALLAEAKKQAAMIVDAAREEADKIVKDAQHQAERIQTNGKRALALAARDTRLKLDEQIQHEFRSWVGNLVRQQLDKTDFMAELIREVATMAVAAIGDDADTEDSDSSARLRLLVDDGNSKQIDAFVNGQTAEMLRRGVVVQVDQALTHGFKLQHLEDNVEIDFTDEAVTAALMRFLAPKFRQLIGSASEFK